MAVHLDSRISYPIPLRDNQQELFFLLEADTMEVLEENAALLSNYEVGFTHTMMI